MLNNFLNNLNISEIFTDFSKILVLFFKKLKILDIRSMFVKFRQNFIKISKKNTNFNAFSWNLNWINYSTLFKNDKIVTTFLLKFWDLSGAKVWKSCRSRKSWKNEYLVAIVAVDTAENGPPIVWINWIFSSSTRRFSMIFLKLVFFTV